MSFLPAISGWFREPSGPNARLHISRTGQRQDRRRLTFVLSRELIELCGWQGGERVVVSIGVGEDLGAFQISRVTKARAGLKLIPVSSQGRGYRVHVTLPPELHGVRPADFLDRLPLPNRMDFAVRDSALELRCDTAANGLSGDGLTGNSQVQP